MTWQTRISLPEVASPGELIEVKTLVSHPMESGYRRDIRGQVIPRNILESFRCDYLGETVFSATYGPGIAANPFLSFFLRASKSGEVIFTWTDQNGQMETQVRQLTVSAP